MPTITSRTISQLYYQILPRNKRKKFLADVIGDTKRNQSTIYDWINGSHKPSAAEQKLFVKRLNKLLPAGHEKVTVEEIFN